MIISGECFIGLLLVVLISSALFALIFSKGPSKSSRRDDSEPEYYASQLNLYKEAKKQEKQGKGST